MTADPSRRAFLRLAGGTVVAGTVVGAAALVAARALEAPSNGSIGAMPRAFRLLGSLENVPLSGDPRYLSCKLVPGEKYRVQTLVKGAPGAEDKVGLVFFDGAGNGQGLGVSAKYGAYVYLRSGPGLYRTDRIISFDRPVSRIGVARYASGGSLELKTLAIETVDQHRPTDFLVSFDVEAMPSLADGPGKIDALVWGKVGGQEYGIRRICDVLDQYSAKATFLVEFASGAHEGDQPLRQIIDFLLSRGHDVQAHLHSDLLSVYWGLAYGQQPLLSNRLSYEMSRRTIDFAVKKYEQIVGKPPRVFRCGGLLVNENTVAAAASLGVEALSNIRRDMAFDHMIDGGDPIDAWEPFHWDNGVLELPLDYNPDPLSLPFEDYLRRYDETVYKKPTEKMFLLLNHSWSLMVKDSRNFYNTYVPEHEKRLHQILGHMKDNGRFLTFSEYMDTHQNPRPIRLLYDIRPENPQPPEYIRSADTVLCNICDAAFSTNVMANEVCPGCGSVPTHRQFAQAMVGYGNVLSGREVLGFESAALKRWGPLSGAKSVVPAESVADLRKASAESVDAVVALRLINNHADAGVIDDVKRVLRPGGLFVSMTPYADGPSQPSGDGSVGFTRDEYLGLLSTSFATASVPGYDPVSGKAARVFIGQKKD